MTVEERGAIVPRFKPEMATLNAGSTNFGLYPIAARNLPFQDWEREYLESTRDYVFRNTFAGITYLAGLMRDAETRPEIEIYDLGQLYNLRQLVNDGVVVHLVRGGRRLPGRVRARGARPHAGRERPGRPGGQPAGAPYRAREDQR